MKIGDKVFVHGYVDEIRKDIIIIRNEGGYFGTVPDEILPSAQPEREDYTEMKREFIRMASYIDSLLVCSDEQKETLMNFISRLAEFMPWTGRD